MFNVLLKNQCYSISVYRHGSVIVDYIVTALETAQADIAVANDAIASGQTAISVPGYSGNVTSMLVSDKEGMYTCMNITDNKNASRALCTCILISSI